MRKRPEDTMGPPVEVTPFGCQRPQDIIDLFTACFGPPSNEILTDVQMDDVRIKKLKRVACVAQREVCKLSKANASCRAPLGCDGNGNTPMFNSKAFDLEAVNNLQGLVNGGNGASKHKKHTK